jgi:hypothetical protein
MKLFVGLMLQNYMDIITIKHKNFYVFDYLKLNKQKVILHNNN